MTDILGSLNDKQREAVLETEGYVRVIAGAGSGKTKLLVSRYAYLVQDYGIDSANILCVTFTNKAAGEMKKRIRTLIGDGNDTGLICTYHGFCNRLLRENPEKLFLNKQFQIIDAHQQKAVLSEIYQKYELKLDYASFESILRKIGAVKRNGEYVAKLCDPRPCQVMGQIKDQDDRIIEEFLQRQKATYALDFHDLLYFAIYLLERDADIREKWQNRLNYIMVDEFQDSSAVEMRLVDVLAGQYRNLMIVGDPDQNIYEWRGSDVRLLVDFDQGHRPTKTIILNQNYRSTPQILQCANTLIEKNELRLKKDLFTKNPSGEAVVHYHSKDDFEEMDQVIKNIKRLQAKEDLKYSDFAILYRSSFLSRIVEKKLVEKNIPYEIFGGVRFYERMEILDILAYLKLIAYDDDVAFRRIINTPRRRFGRAKMNLLEKLRDQDFNSSAEGTDLSGQPTFFATLVKYQKEKEFENSDIGGFVDLIASMRARYRTKRISDIVNEVTKKSGYESYIRELGDEERLDNLAEFKRIANEFEREFGENVSLEGFLQQVALQSGEDESEAKDAVKLMTIHSSKGLEFPVVFILGFTEGVFPSAKTLGDRKRLGLEEERRLCYVAITRAEKHLFLMDSEGTSQNGIKKLVSRFLDEIGESNYVRIGRISEELKKESRGYAAKLNREMQLEMTADKKVGDVVEHHIFGRGVIESIDKKRGSYSIKFEKLQQVRNISDSYFKKERREAQPAEAIPGRAEDTLTGRTQILDNGGKPENKAEDKAGQLQGTDGRGRSFGTPEEEKRESCFDGAENDKGEMFSEVTNAWRLNQEENEEGNRNGNEDGSPTEAELAVGDGENVPGDECGITPREKARLKEVMANSPNLWKHEEVPHSGWNCVGVEDLGEPVGICEMCGHQIIRYVHHMEHSDYRSLAVGCVCAGKMEGDLAEAKRREAEFKNKQARRVKFFQRKWKQSHKGNEYLYIDGHVVVLFQSAKPGHSWKYAIDNEFCRTDYATREKAVAGIFDALEQLRKTKH